MSNLPPEDWRGEHLIYIPRAPKAIPYVDPNAVSPDLRAQILDMGRGGMTVPEISRAVGFQVQKIRDILLKAGVDFKRAKQSAVQQARSDAKRAGKA